MSQASSRSLAIACASGSFKGAFVSGVLSAFEINGILAKAYASASASVLPCALAAIGKASDIGVKYWQKGLQALKQTSNGMSQMVLQSIADLGPLIRNELFRPESSQLFIATSAVITPEAAEQTQGSQAKRLGRRLLVSAGRKDRSWVDEHLQLALFNSVDSSRELRLDVNNFDEVAYASTRMLHAWDIPAWIAARPYVDASYTCLCPAVEMAERGYSEVIAIATEPGVIYRDLFQTEQIPTSFKGVPIHIIQPDVDPKELGVDFTDATEEGLFAVYRHGEEKGREFLTNWGLKYGKDFLYGK